MSGFVQRKWRWLGVGGSEAVEAVLAMLTETVAAAGIPEAERAVLTRALEGDPDREDLLPATRAGLSHLPSASVLGHLRSLWGTGVRWLNEAGLGAQSALNMAEERIRRALRDEAGWDVFYRLPLDRSWYVMPSEVPRHLVPPVDSTARGPPQPRHRAPAGRHLQAQGHPDAAQARDEGGMPLTHQAPSRFVLNWLGSQRSGNAERPIG
ncbi:hypothetical protein ACFTY8_33195 [Streptomyces mirabilis]|uniref:hypothetical protein n=1 Tax=Streptomyces mirabilis TaxID=68239 RepID=UPI00362C871A